MKAVNIRACPLSYENLSSRKGIAYCKIKLHTGHIYTIFPNSMEHKRLADIMHEFIGDARALQFEDLIEQWVSLHLPIRFEIRLERGYTDKLWAVPRLPTTKGVLQDAKVK